MKKDRSLRIGIIGAGPAGLTAAEALKRKGYTSISLLERSERAGGKCCSIEHQGRSYELGAGIVAENNHAVLNLVHRFAVPIHPAKFGANIFIDGPNEKPVTVAPTLLDQLALAGQLLKYYRLCRRYRRILNPGFGNVDPTLCQPFATWAAHHRIPLLAKRFANHFTGFGYGYFTDIPAAYVLKYFTIPTLIAFARQRVYAFADGVQSLWTKVAASHNVIYNSTIMGVTRGESVTVKTTDQTYTFDALIITCPLDEALQYLDASDEEKKLFEKISYCDYRTFACHVRGLPAGDGYLPDNFTAARSGQPIFWHHRYLDSNLITFYALCNQETTDEQVIENIQHMVQDFGGTLDEVHTTARWKYFPHVGADDMRQGYYDQLEKLQGENHTYYIGELLNFSTVGLSAEYAAHLVESRF